MHIHRFPSVPDAVEAAGQALTRLLGAEEPILLLLSGGSAWQLLGYADLPADCSHLTIGMLDERCSTDEEINNFAQFQQLPFYGEAARAGASFLGSLPRRAESAADLAARMEGAWREWRTENATGRIVCTQGIGEDGHTAGIIPPADHRFEAEAWAVGYTAANRFPERATATLTFLREEVDHAIVFACGTSKQTALAACLNADSLAEATPGRVIQEMRDVELFTDLAL